MNLRSVLPGGHGRRLRVRRGAAMVAAVGVAMLGGIAVTATSASADEVKVWVCHATSSDKNPYRIFQVDDNSTKLKGHRAHETTPNKTWKDPTFFGGVNHPAGSDKPDIIGEPGALSAPSKCSEGEGGGGGGKASLTLVKRVSGSNDSPSLWMLHAEGTTEGASTFAPGETGVNHDVEDGTYNLSESVGPTDGYTNAGWTCLGATMSDTDTVVIGADDTDVKCTITNTFRSSEPNPTTLTLTKIVNNDAGGAGIPANWRLMATGLQQTVAGQGSASGTVSPGDYTLLESGSLPNYGASNWSCTDGTLVGNVLTLVAGDDASCTITNTFVPTAELVENVEPATVPATIVKGPVVTRAPVVAAAQVEALAFTGAETVPLGLSGLLAMLLGAGLVATARRQGRRANN